MTLAASLTAADERRPGRGHIGVNQIVLVDLGTGIIVLRTQSQEAVLREYMVYNTVVAAGVGAVSVGVGFGIVALLLVLILKHLLGQRGKQRRGAELFLQVLSGFARKRALADQLHVARYLLGE